MRLHLCFSASLLLAGLAACTGESGFPDATGKGAVRAINAIPTAPQVSFLIEERLDANVDFKNTTPTSRYDDLNYTFNFEAVLAGGTGPARIASQNLDVVKDTAYTFVLTGSLAAPTITLWEAPEPEFASGATNFEVQFGHTSPSMADFDVYFAAPGTVPVVGEEMGTLSFGEVLPPRSFEAGEYAVILTAVGDPATVLHESNAFALVATSTHIISVFDTDVNDLGAVSLYRLDLTSGSRAKLADIDTPASFRFVHGHFDIGGTDIYSDDPLTMPIASNHVFGEITADLPVPSGAVPLTYTAAGNIGSVLVDTDVNSFAGIRSDIYLLEDSVGDGVLIANVADRRSVATLARFSIINTAVGDTSLDVYVVPTVDPPLADPLAEENPLFSGLPVGIPPATASLTAGSFDLYATPQGEKTVLAGPITRDFALGDVIEAIIYESVNPPAVDLVFLTP